jgi:multicomponent Na+:H+ antiporter subunit A
MLFVVLAGFAVAPVAPFLVRSGRAAGWILAILPAILFISLAGTVPQIAAGQKLLFQYDWLPELGVSLSLCLDGLSLLFSLLVTGVGALVCLYSPSYLSGHPDLGKFASSLFLFMGSMLGLVLADDLIALFMFWELTSIASYLLIGFDHGREAARKSALQALLVTGLGGLALLAGILLVQQVAGTLQLSAIRDGGVQWADSPLYEAIVLFFLLGIATKSAQVPFHFWLPSAMEAPTPVSTYLHAATMVKAGVYLAARMTPILGDTELWHHSLTVLGATTMAMGAWLALFQTDLKRILAHSTVSALGILILLVGIGTEISLQACMVFLAAHGMYKGALFLAAGIIDHETGTRDVERLGRLGKAMPLTFAATMLAALSSAGIPPFLGYLGKETLYAATLATAASTFLTALTVLASISLVSVAAIIALRPFLRSEAALPRHPHDPPLEMWLGPLLLGAFGLLSGLAPALLNRLLFAPAVSAVLGKAPETQLALWHGLDLKVLLSLTALLGGGLVFRRWGAVRRLPSGLFHPVRWGPSRWYEAGIMGLEAFAAAQTRFVQSGHLQRYLLTVIVAAAGLLAWSLAMGNFGIHDLDLERWTNVRTYEAVIAAVIIMATLIVVKSHSRLEAVVALGVVGYGTALTFLVFSAPDLAMTQFAIETLSVILLVLVLFKLPRYRKISTNRERVRDGLVAVAAGAIMTLLVLIVTSEDRTARLVSYFAENSFLQAKGRNVVNVILVDFRGFDTLGEITVLSIAAIGVYALVRLKPKQRPEDGPKT